MLRLSMRIVFMGSPQFSVPSLEAISSHYEIIGVFTQPDRPAGRGRKLQASEVKTASLDLGIPVFQPKKIRQEDAVAQLVALSPDLIIVAAYGQILSQSILDIPRLGSVNVHASLLPNWRGAAPIQASILNGETVTGITIMLMDAGMDTGPILSQAELEIEAEETGGELASRLSLLGAELLLDTLPGYINGEIRPSPQEDDKATYAPMIQKSDGLLDFNKAADLLERQVRAYEPWPTSYLVWEGRRIVVRSAHSKPSDETEVGLVLKRNGHPAIVTTKGALVLDLIQPAGKKPMRGDAFLRGSPNFSGCRLA
jgi:methionyl-tRNA formyltransferase